MKVDHNILELSTLQVAKRNKEKNAQTTGISARGAVEGNLGIEQKEGEKILADMLDLEKEETLMPCFTRVQSHMIISQRL